MENYCANTPGQEELSSARQKAQEVLLHEILKARGRNYGPFHEQAMISQEIKLAIFRRISPKVHLREDQKEVLEMIAMKISRIINGDPDYIDNWDDIAGYATLVANRLRGGQPWK